MKLVLLDKSNYFKALLILTGMDGEISDEEKYMLREFSESLGFNKKFTQEAINDLLSNECIIYEPPTFSNLRIAEDVIRDGIKLAYSDGFLCKNEFEWLKLIAINNNLSEMWLRREIIEYIWNNNLLNSKFPFNKTNEFETKIDS